MYKKQRIPSFFMIGAVVLFFTVLGCNVKTAPEAKVEAAATPQPEPKPGLMSWRVATAYLEDLFAQIPNSSIDDFRKDTPSGERKLINASHGETGVREDNAHVYGEPAPLTTDLMLKGLGAGENDVIYDLGCGRGFFLMQALMTTPARKAVGIELSASRVNVGKQA